MAIYKGYKISKARELGEQLGREGVSIKVVEAIRGWDGSYKGAMDVCGRLTFLADVSAFDEYWMEQVERGVSSESLKGFKLLESKT